MTGVSATARARLQRSSLGPLGPGFWIWAAMLGAGAIAAIAIARNAGVQGPSAAPDVLRTAVAALGFFALCGYAPARLLTPAPLARDWPLLVLPLGAVCGSLAPAPLGLPLLPRVVNPPPVGLAAIVAGLGAPPAGRRPRPAAG